MSHTPQPTESSDEKTLTVTLDYNPRREEIFSTLKSKYSYPENLVTTLTPERNPITLSCNPAGIRWIYDELVELGNKYEAEGEEYMHTLSHEAADIIYQKVKDNITITCKTSPP